MPTRVRNMYLGMVREGRGSDEELSWLSMDRDLEMAIFEFAPGSVLVKDKEKHKAVGFTGSNAGTRASRQNTSWRTRR